MSKNVIDALVEFIMRLDEDGIIEVEELIDRIPVQESVVMVLRPKKRNYSAEEIVAALMRVDKVFLPEIDSRQKIWYLKERVEEISGMKASYREAWFGNEKGYVIYFEGTQVTDEP